LGSGAEPDHRGHWINASRLRITVTLTKGGELVKEAKGLK
jgi:hypothetical protein